MSHAISKKVFCIGFHKTGTTSLASALDLLGYWVTGPDGVNDPDIGKNVYEMADRLIPQFDAFQDNPWPLLFRYVDERCPGSKFILTLRPTDEWFRSLVTHFGSKTTPMREWIYGVGSPIGNEEIYKERYERHNAEVLEHFADRPEDLLVFKVTEGHGWKELCGFLDANPPDMPFPHKNRSGFKRKIRSFVESAGEPAPQEE